MSDDKKRRILADITDAAKAADRAEHRLDALYVDARVAGASFREIAAATQGRATHQTIVNRLAALQTREAPMITVATDATAGTLQTNVQDLYRGQIAPGISGGIYPQVTLPEAKATQLIAALQERGYKAWTEN